MGGLEGGVSNPQEGAYRADEGARARSWLALLCWPCERISPRVSADRGYKEYLEGSSKPRVDRYRSGLGSSGIGVLSGSNTVAIGVNKRMRDTRDSPDPASRKTQRMEERYCSDAMMTFAFGESKSPLLASGVQTSLIFLFPN